MSDPEIDHLLTPAPLSANSPLRERLLDRTTALLRRRIWQRRVARAAAFAACFLVGILALAMRQHPPARPVPPNEMVQEKEPSNPVEPATGNGLEWVALESPDERAALYRKAGDRYLEEKDLEAALRCYTQSLDRGGDEDLTVQLDDAWLLILIKDARQKEKNDAKTRG
jgi:hypothetical protein